METLEIAHHGLLREESSRNASSPDAPARITNKSPAPPKAKTAGAKATELKAPETPEVKAPETPELKASEEKAPEAPSPKPGEEAPAWDRAGLDPQVHIELLRLRAQMSSPKSARVFDDFVAQQRSPEQALRALQGMSRGEGGLEQTLLARATRQAERTAVREAHGESVAEALELGQQARTLQTRMEQSVLQGRERWRPRIRAEIQRLTDIEAGRTEATPETVQSIRNNVRGLEGELNDALARNAEQVNVDVKYGNGKTLDIDSISNSGRTWTEIKVKEPFTTASKTWAGEILPKAQKMVEAGREHGVSDLRFSFPRGVDASVKAALESMGFTVEGP